VILKIKGVLEFDSCILGEFDVIKLQFVDPDFEFILLGDVLSRTGYGEYRNDIAFLNDGDIKCELARNALFQAELTQRTFRGSKGVQLPFGLHGY
jgi:hypothetical protein